MKVKGVVSKLRLTKGSTDSTPKVQLTMKTSDEELLSFHLGELEVKKLAREYQAGKISVECDKKPQQNGNLPLKFQNQA